MRNDMPLSLSPQTTYHLGNIRQVTGDDGSKKGEVIQKMKYYPFGAEFCDNSTKSYVQNHKYNGKEFDNMHGLNTYDYGARQYNPILCRMDKIDRFCEKDYSHSPYAYCMGNPVSSIDVNGDSCIVLLAPDGANGYGHMAMGIQDKNGTWRLYSKNGTEGCLGASGKEPPVGKEKHNDRGEKKADNLYDFLHDTSINPKNKNGKPEYTEGFLMATTPEQDDMMETGALVVLNQDYNVLTSNCAQTVQRALKYGGLNPGSGLKPKASVYPSIVENNKGVKITIYNPQLSQKSWK